jgi:hypothetical protein
MFAIMSSMKPMHTISADAGRAEVHFATGGYWYPAGMKQFLFDLGEAAKPLMKKVKTFTALGDFSDFSDFVRRTAKLATPTATASARPRVTDSSDLPCCTHPRWCGCSIAGLRRWSKSSFSTASPKRPPGCAGPADLAAFPAATLLSNAAAIG